MSPEQNNPAVRNSTTILIALLVCWTASLIATPQRVCGAETKTETKTVELTIDYGDGSQKRFTQLAWARNMTAQDAMIAAREHRRGIQFKHRGRGSFALLTQIDDLSNQGGGSTKKNWIFWVNGKRATKGFGALVLQPGDKVLWKFTVYRANPRTAP